MQMDHVGTAGQQTTGGEQDLSSGLEESERRVSCGEPSEWQDPHAMPFSSQQVAQADDVHGRTPSWRGHRAKNRVRHLGHARIPVIMRRVACELFANMVYQPQLRQPDENSRPG